MKKNLKISALLVLLFLPFAFIYGAHINRSFDKSVVYNAMAGNNLSDINEAIAQVQQSNVEEKIAYEGALLMKKASVVSKPKDKLSNFKAGRKKLEDALNKEPGNVEYHFLRLMIQENAPKIVHYHSDIEEDSKLIKNSFKKLPSRVQKAVKDYSKNSKALNSSNI